MGSDIGSCREGSLDYLKSKTLEWLQEGSSACCSAFPASLSSSQGFMKKMAGSLAW